jgi:2-polyprenyl-3-methyl-5-hydroxy-6-metoxy-1,4-benzoquinol methylase
MSAMGHEQAPTGDPTAATAHSDYADRLVRLRSARWKHIIDVQAPYRWNISRLRLGHTLDVGCGIGRNLQHLGAGAVGIDHNADSVAVARAAGLTAYTREEFLESADCVPASFDTVLLAHVVEHMAREAAIGLLTDNLTFLRPGGQVVFITPQEAGYRTDETHVRFVDFDGLADLAAAIGFAITRRYSFPFPRMIGRVFPHNEFVAVCAPARLTPARIPAESHWLHGLAAAA